MRWYWVLLAVCGVGMSLAGTARAEEVVLAKEGKTDYAIVVGKDAGPATKYAAEELRRFVEEMTGAKLEITGDDRAAREQEILLGDSARLRTVAKDLDLKGLGEEGYLIRTVGGRLVIAGNTGRGNLYGAYGLLEDHFGCQWFTPKISRIPHVEKLAVGALDEKKIPALEYREVMAFDLWEPDWMARNHVNTTKLLDARHGGAVKYVPEFYVHTFGKLLPAEKYFKTHPEYFSEVAGKRVADQLCPTNEEVIKLVTERVREAFRANPDAKVLSISQNDTESYCQCATCAALDAKEGTHAAQVLFLVNRVAENVAKEFPDRAVETLAYEWSRQPPKTMKPAKNVIIRLSTIKCSFGEPIDGWKQSGNRAFSRDLEKWASVCDRLWVWDYTTNFSYYVLPFPNQRVIDANLRYFVKNHVTGVVEQGNWQSKGAGMCGLTGYLAATFMWKPNADLAKVTTEYLEGVYGAAAPAIQKYLDLLAGEVEKEHIAMPIYGSRTPKYLTEEVLRAGDKLWDEAETAVAGNPELLKRVEEARLGHDYAYIEHWRFKPEGMVTYDGNPKNGKVTAIDDGYAAHIRRFLKVAKAAGIENIREGKPDFAEEETWLNSLLKGAPEK